MKELQKYFMIDLRYFIHSLNFHPHDVFHIGRFVMYNHYVSFVHEKNYKGVL